MRAVLSLVSAVLAGVLVLQGHALAQDIPAQDSPVQDGPSQSVPSQALEWPPRAPGQTSAQPLPPQGSAAAISRGIVTVDQEQMYLMSAWGKRADGLVAERLDAVKRENDRLFADLSAEEAELTRLRATLPPDEFRKRAAAFDEHVTVLRREREAASLEVSTLANAERAAFFEAAIPVIGELMRERGAIVVLDPRTVLMSAEAVDMTDAVVKRLDDEVGDGAGKVRLPDVKQTPPRASGPVPALPGDPSAQPDTGPAAPAETGPGSTPGAAPTDPAGGGN